MSYLLNVICAPQVLHLYERFCCPQAINLSLSGTQSDAEKALKAFTDVVAEELKKGEKVQLVGFGTFEVSERAEREGRNPQTGETMKIAACKAPKFKAGKALKDAINA